MRHILTLAPLRAVSVASMLAVLFRRCGNIWSADAEPFAEILEATKGQERCRAGIVGQVLQGGSPAHGPRCSGDEFTRIFASWCDRESIGWRPALSRSFVGLQGVVAMYFVLGMIAFSQYSPAFLS